MFILNAKKSQKKEKNIKKIRQTLTLKIENHNSIVMRNFQDAK